MNEVNVVVEHPVDADLLFVGKENAAWVSTDAGASWVLLPHVPGTGYDAMVMHPREKDLVMGTHGRSIWILDDTRFRLAEWSATARSAPAHLFSAGDGTLLRYRKDNSDRAQADFAGENPPDGIELTYRLRAGSGDTFDQVARSDGTVVRRMKVPATDGVHRVKWNLRHCASAKPDTWAGWDDPDYLRPPQVRGGPTGSQPAVRAADAEGEAATRLRALAREVAGFSRLFGEAGRFYDGNFDPPKAADLARPAELEAALKGEVCGEAGALEPRSRPRQAQGRVGGTSQMKGDLT